MPQDTVLETLARRKPLVYVDFNLRFGRYQETDGGGSFEVWVEGDCPGGAMRPDDATPCTYAPAAFYKDPSRPSGGLLGGLERRRLSRQQLFQLGGLLADLALPEGPVRTLFRQSMVALQPGEGLRLRLHVDPVALVYLPWEYMTLPRMSGEPQATDFFALNRLISIVRSDTVQAAAQPLPDRERARIVGVLSSPDDQKDLDVEEDRAAIVQAVQSLNQATGQDLIQVFWVERPATRAALEAALSEGADILHFAGHAIFDPVSREGKLILETEDYESDFYGGGQLAQLLASAGVRLVVLGACETGRRDGQNVWSGVAPALTRERIPAVIANQFKIKDDHAILVAAKVYHRLLAGFSVDEALYEARQAIYQQAGLEQRDWGVPVLYLHDPDGVLFPLPEADVPEAASTGPFLRVVTNFQRISGRVLNAKIGTVTGGRIDIVSSVNVVEETGEFVGIEIDLFG